MLSLGMITVVVDEYDDAISHYVNDLGFTLVEHTVLTPEKRWVVVSPGSSGAQLLLAKASGEIQTAAIGNSTGGRVAFFLYTDNFTQTYESYLARGVEFTESPRSESFGRLWCLKINMAISGI